MSVLLANVLLALAWGAITGSFGFLNLLFGFVLAALALSLIREQIGTSGALARIHAGLPFSLRAGHLLGSGGDHRAVART